MSIEGGSPQKKESRDISDMLATSSIVKPLFGVDTQTSPSRNGNMSTTDSSPRNEDDFEDIDYTDRNTHGYTFEVLGNNLRCVYLNISELRLYGISFEFSEWFI